MGSPEVPNFSNDEADNRFRDIDSLEHLAEGGEIIPDPPSLRIPTQLVDFPDRPLPPELEWGVPGAENGDKAI